MEACVGLASRVADDDEAVAIRSTYSSLLEKTMQLNRDLTDNEEMLKQIAADNTRNLKWWSSHDEDEAGEGSPAFDEGQLDDLLAGASNWPLLGSESFGVMW